MFHFRDNTIMSNGHQFIRKHFSHNPFSISNVLKARLYISLTNNRKIVRAYMNTLSGFDTAIAEVQMVAERTRLLTFPSAPASELRVNVCSVAFED